MCGVKPIILGCSGSCLSHEEAAFFAQVNPFGFILFQRNCEDPAQLKDLTASLRAAIGREEAPIFIDQEGGRVARLKPPYWPSLPPARRLGALYEQDPALGRMAVHLHALATAHMLADVGINGNCAPVLDLFVEGASTAIGDRAFSSDPHVVAACGRVAVETYLKNGIFPVIKHMPGHGRVKVDPHIELPFVDAASDLLEAGDFAPFVSLQDAPIAMNCHVVYRALDAELPASLSKAVHTRCIRGRLGFDGLLFSDDLAMGALQGNLGGRAKSALEAGADIVLYCTGVLSRMEEICQDLPDISSAATIRWSKAQSVCAEKTQPINIDATLERLALALSAWSVG